MALNIYQKHESGPETARGREERWTGWAVRRQGWQMRVEMEMNGAEISPQRGSNISPSLTTFIPYRPLIFLFPPIYLSYFAKKRCTIKLKEGYLTDIEYNQHTSLSVYV